MGPYHDSTDVFTIRRETGGLSLPCEYTSESESGRELSPETKPCWNLDVGLPSPKKYAK